MKNVLCRLILFAALIVMPCAARTGTYSVERKSSLSGAAEVITVQLAVAATKNVAFDGASVYCSAACEITIERDGTLATTTALTPQKLNSWDAAPVATAYHSSNVGTGTVIGRQIIPAGQMMTLDLKDKGLLAGENLTIRTDSITATVIINIQWREY